MCAGDNEPEAALPTAGQAAQEAGPECLGRGCADPMPSTARLPSELTPVVMVTATLTMRPASRTFR
jgi:hypothetical protein